jgi:hypothetical protein
MFSNMFCLTMTLGLSSMLFALPSIEKLSDSIVDVEALTIHGPFGSAINGLAFQQEAVVGHNGYQYVGYYNGDRHVCLARRQLPAGIWERIEFSERYLDDDAHEVMSIGICPKDGTIHMTNYHKGRRLQYRVSQKNAATNPSSVTWDASLFGPVRNNLENGKDVGSVTYPAFFQTPSGDMQMVYRVGGSGNGDWQMVDYCGTTHQWSNTRTFISRHGTFKDQYDTSTARCAYPNHYQYGPDGKLHVTWVWRETTQGANHDIMYSYSPDSGITWLNGGTSVIGQAPDSPIRLDSPGVTVVIIPRKYGLMNTQAQAIDPQGRVHTVFWHCSDDSFDYAARLGYNPHASGWGHPHARRYHHYWRDSNGVWQHHEMKWVAGSRPQLFIRPNGDAFLIYNAPNPQIENGIYFNTGDLAIAAATAQSKWTDWKVIHAEPGPFLNEMHADRVRFKQDQILSIMVQESPAFSRQSTPLRIIDFTLTR